MKRAMVWAVTGWSLAAGVAAAQYPPGRLVAQADPPPAKLPDVREVAPPPPAPLPAADPAKVFGVAPPPAPPANPHMPPGSVGNPWMPCGPDGTCRGPLGNHGPIGSELYLRTGPVFSISDGELGDRLGTGWAVQGGGRTMLFNKAMSRAWVFDLGLGYTYQNGEGDSESFPFEGLTNTVRGLHRTAVRFGVGHEWYLFAPAYSGPVKNLRIGADVAALYGTSHLDLNILEDPVAGYNRVHDVYAGFAIGGQVQYDIPMGGWFFSVGGRLEWQYNDLNFVPQFGEAYHDLRVLLYTGIRF